MNVIGKEITQSKSQDLQATLSRWKRLKGHVIYIDHFGNVVTNIKKYFIEVAKGRPYEIVLKTKKYQTILPNYLPLQV
jgi:S-adenosylmethionine hydrolase